MGPVYHKGVPCPWESLESPLIERQESAAINKKDAVVVVVVVVVVVTTH